MQTVPPRLRTLLISSTLPRLLVLIVTVSIVLFSVTLYFIFKEANKLQQQSISDLEQNLSFVVRDTTRQLADLAGNDIIINALIDFEQRDNYLPMFFRSLSLTQAKRVEFALFDYTGNKIIDKNWTIQIPNSLDAEWRQYTLGSSIPYSSISHNGVIISVPILMRGVAEGALVMYVDSLQSLLAPYPRLTNQLVTDSEDRVLFSSEVSLIPPSSNIKNFDHGNYLIKSKKWQNLTLFSLKPKSEILLQAVWIGVVLLIMIIGFIFITWHMLTLTALMAESTLLDLYKDIKSKIDGQPTLHKSRKQDDARELINIRQAFDKLVNDLTNVSISKEQFSNILESIGDMLFVVDERNNVLLCNKRYSNFCDSLECSHDDTLQFILQRLSSKQSDELTHFAKSDNGKAYIRWTKTSLIDSHGTSQGSIYVGSDVTQRRTLESNVKILNHAIEEATVSIIISNVTKSDQPVVYVNSAFEALTGYKKEEIIGQNCKFMQGVETDYEAIESVRTAIKNRAPIDITLLNYKKSGQPFYNRLNLTPVSIDGEVTHYIGFQQDVTQQHQTEQYLNDAKEKAEESARLKSSFLASMSHEIRTPIHGISGVLQLLESSPLSEDQAHYLSLAKFSIQSLLHIVNDILDFSKIEAGQMQVEDFTFDIRTTLNNLESQYAIICEEKGLQLLFSNDLQGHDFIKGDEVRLRQILSNLLGNAIKFTDTGSIKVTTHIEKQSDKKLVLNCSVEDTGIGIAPDKQNNIFDVFTQEDLSTTRKFGGTGLGLSISKQLCELMGGSIHLDSEKGVGSTFSFSVEFKVADEVEINTTKSHALLKSQPHKKYKVLIVEDNEINQVIAKQHLADYTTLSAMTGKEAIQALSQTKVTFDVVLMDCQMPEMDGFEATKRIRQGEVGERYIKVPIIALTANAMKGDKEKCKNAGMDDYLSKPFEVEDLIEKVEYWSCINDDTDPYPVI